MVRGHAVCAAGHVRVWQRLTACCSLCVDTPHDGSIVQEPPWPPCQLVGPVLVVAVKPYGSAAMNRGRPIVGAMQQLAVCHADPMDILICAGAPPDKLLASGADEAELYTVWVCTASVDEIAKKWFRECWP